MTVSRLSPDLDRVIDSTWLTGSDGAAALSVATDEWGTDTDLWYDDIAKFPRGPIQRISFAARGAG